MLGTSLLFNCLLLLIVGVLQSERPGGSSRVEKLEITPIDLLQPCSAPEAGAQSGSQVAALLNRLKTDNPPEEVLIEQVASLGRSCDSSALDPLLDLLSNPSIRVRLAAIEALGRLNDPAAVMSLAVLVSSESDQVRLAIARTLLSINKGNARSVALNSIASPGNALKGEEDMRLRARVVLTLNDLTNNAFNRKAILFLHVYLNSTDAMVVRIAEETLRQLPATRNGSREMLGIIRNSSSPLIRAWMCSWIGRLKIVEGREVLAQTAEKDSNEKVRAAAAEALTMLGH